MSKKYTSTKCMFVFRKKSLHPRKLTCPPKRDNFYRKYIFQPLIFRGHVSFLGSKCKLMQTVLVNNQTCKLLSLAFMKNPWAPFLLKHLFFRIPFRPILKPKGALFISTYFMEKHDFDPGRKNQPISLPNAPSSQYLHTFPLKCSHFSLSRGKYSIHGASGTIFVLVG